MIAVAIIDQPAKSRFEAQLDGELVGIADYRLAGDRIVFTYAEVPPDHERQRIGSSLVRYALDQVRAAGTDEAGL